MKQAARSLSTYGNRMQILGLFLGVSLTGCASLGQKNDSMKEDLSITSTSEQVVSDVPAELITGVVDYKYGNGTYKVEYMDCKIKSPKKTMIAVHSDRAGFATDKFCSGWIAQSFLSQGYDVIAVNRPGYGKSTGTPDFSGAQSLAAMQEGVKAALANGKNAKQPSLIWGYDTGVTGAALLAKKMTGISHLILGAGVYDYEQTLEETKDNYLKSDLKKIKDTGGNKAIEDRSIAYDISKLPKNILIYHGKLDTAVSPDQAKAFSDSLESGEYHVTYQELDGVTHNIPWMHHRKILEVLARSTL